MNDALYLTFSQPQSGSFLPVFSGTRNMRGDGLFSSIARIAFPILKTIGRRLLGAVAYLSGNKKFVPSMVDEFIDEGKQVIPEIPTMFAESINKMRKRKSEQEQEQPKQEGSSLLKRRKANF